MFIIKDMRTGEKAIARSKEEAEATVRTYVAFTNDRIKRGIIKGKRVSKKNFAIIEA